MRAALKRRRRRRGVREGDVTGGGRKRSRVILGRFLAT